MNNVIMKGCKNEYKTTYDLSLNIGYIHTQDPYVMGSVMSVNIAIG